MSRLPVPGSDANTWGDVLNDFLAQEHNADGSQKDLPQSKITGLTSDLTNKLAKTGDTMSGTLVAPSLRITGGSPASGQFLTADNSGNANWQIIPDQTPQLSWGTLLFATDVSSYGAPYSPASAAFDPFGKVHLRGLLFMSVGFVFGDTLATLPLASMYPFYKKLVWATDTATNDRGVVLAVNTDGTIKATTTLNAFSIMAIDGVTFDTQS